MLTELSDTQLADLAPAIFAENPHSARSDNYTFLPTIDVINFLRTKDIFPVAATQRRNRSEEYRKTGVHMVTFSLENHFDNIQSEVPQIIIMNSHDGSRAYNFSMGVFRFVCSNGLVIKSSDYGNLVLEHRHDFEEKVFTIANSMIDNFKDVFPKIDAMKSKMLSYEQTAMLANDAAKTRYPKGVPFDPKNLLEVRRDEDREDNLWNVYNRVQENLLKGGFVGVVREKPDRPRRIRALSDINATYNVNRDLWEVAEQYLETV